MWIFWYAENTSQGCGVRKEIVNTPTPNFFIGPSYEELYCGSFGVLQSKFWRLSRKLFMDYSLITNWIHIQPLQKQFPKSNSDTANFCAWPLTMTLSYVQQGRVKTTLQIKVAGWEGSIMTRGPLGPRVIMNLEPCARHATSYIWWQCVGFVGFLLQSSVSSSVEEYDSNMTCDRTFLERSHINDRGLFLWRLRLAYVIHGKRLKRCA